MPAEPPVERIRRAWRARTSGAAEQALLALSIAVVVGGARLARIGTIPVRAAAAALILGAVALHFVNAARKRREAASDRLAVERVLFATDPLLGQRALR